MPELLGKTLEEQTKVDMLAGTIWDLKKSATIGCYTNGDRNKLSDVTLSKLEPISIYLS
jgi:hypothetical protein